MMTQVPAAPPVGLTSTTSFREPTRDAPPGWGPYGLRYVLGLVLIWLGPLLVVREMVGFYRYYRVSGVSVAAELLGYALLVVGWLVLPGRLPRRGGAAAIALVSVLVYAHGLPSIPYLAQGGSAHEVVLHGYWGVPAQLVAIVGMLTAWLVVRERRGPAWALLPAGLFLQLVVSVVHEALSAGELSTYFFFDGIPLDVRSTDFESVVTLRLALGWVVLVVVPSWAVRALARWASPAPAASRAEGAVEAAVPVWQRTRPDEAQPIQAQPTQAQLTRGVDPAAAWDPSRTTNTSPSSP